MPFFFSRYNRFAVTFAAAGCISLTALQAQSAVHSSALVSSTDSNAPAGLTESAVPTVPSKKKHGWHETKMPAGKQINAKVTGGVLTVDGMVAKVHLNYDIHHAGYLYFFDPGVGTVVVSRTEMYGSTKVLGALHGNTLAFKVNGHDFELSSETAMGEGKVKSADLFVRLDSQTEALARTPMMGFGDTTQSPYSWPLSGQQSKDTEEHAVTPPPIPANLLPRTAASAAGATTTAANDRPGQP